MEEQYVALSHTAKQQRRRRAHTELVSPLATLYLLSFPSLSLATSLPQTWSYEELWCGMSWESGP